MKLAAPDDLLHRLSTGGIVAVLIVEDPTKAVRLARALLAGGINIMELTLRTERALDCLRAITSEVPEMLAGAGTVIFPEQVDQVVDAGANFAVAPGTNPSVIRRSLDLGLPFAPGIVTPTDIDTAVQCGCRLLKFFPAEPSGGLPMLRSLKAPYAHLGLKYIPLGGITTTNLDAWLSDPDVIAVGGSWLASKDLIDAERWDDITAAAATASAIVRNARRF
jgi:2-dehydro-3-deoxyphosphogluconate aldolase/(4S)-4-hydroxy-2-oxoglutarate aldolase